MGGKSTAEQQQQQTTTTNPYAPTIPLISGIANQATGLLDTTKLTPDEQYAIDQLSKQYYGGNQFAGGITNYANLGLAGGGQLQYQPGVTSALDAYKTALTPYTTGGGLQSPELQAALSQVRTDAADAINPQFAAAGRDLSGANTEALARGIAKGEAPLILGQYNTDVTNRLAAINNLYSGNLSGYGALSGLQSAGFGAMGTGATAADTALTANQWGPSGLLNLASYTRGIPTGVLGQLANIGVPLAGLGGTTNMVGSQQITKNMAPVEVAQGWANVAGKLFGGSQMGAVPGFKSFALG